MVCLLYNAEVVRVVPKSEGHLGGTSVVLRILIEFDDAETRIISRPIKSIH
jgi:hypothetical protein